MKRRLLALGLALGLFVLAWVAWRPLPSPEPAAQEERAAVAAVVPIVVPAPPAASLPVEAAALPTCPHQQLDFAAAQSSGSIERSCVGLTRTSQTGSVRRYILEAERPSVWSLTLDTAGGQVIAARLSAERRASYRCAGARCQGFEISRPDRHGARTVTITDALLTADTVTTGVRLRATLQTVPDSQSSALACKLPSLTIVEGDGALTEFCPMGGTGFELDGTDRFRYVFRDLEGQTVVITLAHDGSVLATSYGSLVCRGSACGGVTSSGAEAPGGETQPRSFEFSGAFLADATHPGATATLNGRLLMPLQD